MDKQLFQVSIQHDRPIKDMIESALKDLGGLHHIIPSERRLLIKPNLVIAKTNDTGATTNPEVIEVLIQEVLKTNPAEIALGESSTAGDHTMKAFRVTGMDKIAQKYGVKIIDFKKAPHINKEIPRGQEIRSVKIYQPIFEYDYLINVPVLKVHSGATVTIGMKNLKGCIHDHEKHRFHRLNLHRCILDLNTVIRPDLTVVDATTCALQWELGGEPVKLDTIIVGENVLAVDIIAASLLGYGLDDVHHLKMASESGLGPKTMEEITILNPIHTEIKEKVKDAMQKREPEYRLSDLKVIEEGTCSSCKGALVAAIRRLSKEGYSPDCTVVMGQLVEGEDKLEKAKNQARSKGIPMVGIGQCGIKALQSELAKNIKGCPVRAEQIYSILKKLS